MSTAFDPIRPVIDSWLRNRCEHHSVVTDVKDYYYCDFRLNARVTGAIEFIDTTDLQPFGRNTIAVSLHLETAPISGSDEAYQLLCVAEMFDCGITLVCKGDPEERILALQYKCPATEITDERLTAITENLLRHKHFIEE